MPSLMAGRLQGLAGGGISEMTLPVPTSACLPLSERLTLLHLSPACQHLPLLTLCLCPLSPLCAVGSARLPLGYLSVHLPAGHSASQSSHCPPGTSAT